MPEEIQKIWDESPVKRSAAEWGLRFVWDHPEVTVVLSGMNDEAHIDENIRVAGSALPQSLTPDDRDRIGRARDTYRRLMKVGCTGCGYCMPCPPASISPARFLALQRPPPLPERPEPQSSTISGGTVASSAMSRMPGSARECGKCAKACPQHLPIPQLMKDVKADMEGGMRVAVPVLKGGLWCMNKAAKVRALVSGEKSHD